MKISYSAISSWLKCPQSFKYNYIEALEPVAFQEHLAIGIFVHAGIEALFKNVDPVAAIERVAERSRAKNPHNHKEIEGFVASAIKKTEMLRTWLPVDEWEPVTLDGSPMIEHRFELNIDGFDFVGQFDLVAKHLPTGRIFLFDHKTRSTLKADEQELSNLQLVLYQKALLELGIDVVGSIILQIKSDQFATPQILKNGTMSKAKINTTWDLYKKELNKHGMIVESYLEMKEKLAEVEWFRVSKVYRPKNIVQKYWDNVILTAVKEMTQNKDNQILLRRVDPFNCTYCSFQPICHGELDGLDTESIISIGFRKKGGRQ